MLDSNGDRIGKIRVAAHKASQFNGNTSGIFGDNSVTHSDPVDLAPYWQVDLDSEKSLSRMVLRGRIDCCVNRLTNFHIAILDATTAAVEGDDFFTDLNFPDTTANGLEWTPSSPVDGRFVRIDCPGPDSEGNTVLSLAEVQVFSNATDIVLSGSIPAPALR